MGAIIAIIAVAFIFWIIRAISDFILIGTTLRLVSQIPKGEQRDAVIRQIEKKLESM